MEDVGIQFLIAIWFIVWIISSITGGVIRGVRHMSLMERLTKLENQITNDLDAIKNKL